MALPTDADVRVAALDFLRGRPDGVSNEEMAKALAAHFQLADRDLAKRTRPRHGGTGELAWPQKPRRVKAALVAGGDLKSERGRWLVRR